jgi:carboxylesterase type B
MSAQMINYWTNFAISGTPNKPQPVNQQWPEFNMQTQAYMHFAAPNVSVIPFIRNSNCNFWDSMGYTWGVEH